MNHGWSVTIGSIGGTVVRIHLTFLLLLGWIGVAAWRSSGLGDALADVLFLVLLFGCVLLHEFGHVGVARTFGIVTRDITIYPIGGLASIDSTFGNPRQELAIAAAGPVVSVALAIGLALVAGTLPDQPVRDATSGWREMAGTLAVANLALALFNLLPIFPMDGGRMFRALLSWWLGRSVGTGIAAWVGRIGGVGFILYGLVRGEFLLALIGGFVLLSASAESAAVARSTATDESAESGRTDR